METMHLERNETGSVDMDKMLAEINKLPKVQRAILHMHLSDQMLPGHNDGKLRDINVARANWLYDGSKK